MGRRAYARVPRDGFPIMTRKVLDNLDILLISLLILSLVVIYTATQYSLYKAEVYACSDLGNPPDVVEMCRKAKR